MKRLRVLVLMDPALVPPDSTKGYTAQEVNEWKTEYDIVSTLRAAGHEVRPFGVEDELKAVRDEIDGFKPDVVFTLLEDFHGKVIYDQNVASFLELMQVPYTGCNPRGLILARGKDLSKTLVHYRRIAVPAFAVFPKAPQGQAAGASRAAADRQEPERGRIAGHLASIRGRHRREARRARRFHPRADPHRRDRRAVHRGARALCRRAGQRAAAGAAGVGAEIRQPGPRCMAHCHGEDQTRSHLSGARSGLWMGRPRILRRSYTPGFSEQRNGSTGHSISTDMRASTFASLPTAFRISSKQIPIPKSRRARSSRQRPSMTVSLTRTCCIAFWLSE